MAKNKKSFIAYSDWDAMFQELPDEVAGKLIKHIFSYVNDRNPEADDYIIKALFANIKATLKRDLQKWEEQRQQRSEAGKRSAEVRLKKMNDRSTTVNEAERKSTVNVSVSDSVNVNDNVNEKNNTKTSAKNEFLQEREILNFVKDYFDADTIKGLTKSDKEKWLETINKLNRIDGYDYETIKKVIIWGRQDSFWSSNFLSVAALRKKNAGITKFHQMLKKMEGEKRNANQYQQKPKRIPHDTDF